MQDRSIAVMEITAFLIFKEAIGIAALEAMVAGLQVVASAVGGLPELVEDGKYGWLVRLADPNAIATRLIQVLLDRGLVS